MIGRPRGASVLEPKLSFPRLEFSRLPFLVLVGTRGVLLFLLDSLAHSRNKMTKKKHRS